MSLSKRYFEVQAEREQPAARLESVRASLRSVSRNITISEGRLLDFDSAEDMQRTLNGVMRELEALQLAVSVMQRKEVLANG